MTLNTGTRLAALDLGSNSFRLEIGYYDHGTIYKQEYYKEAVHQGAGLDEHNQLSEAAMQRGWDCLARFAERLAGFKHAEVRAVATQTLREATNRDVFLSRAQTILGFPIDVISGHEEARLIYQGVAHNLPQSDEKRLVVDIGGRSTEFILGEKFNAKTMQSYRLGSSAWSQCYFAEGQLTEENFHTARVAAMAILDETMTVFGQSNWDIAYGSSGTVGAVASILKHEKFDAEYINQLSLTVADVGDGIITRTGLLKLQAALLQFKQIEHIKFEGLKDDRRLVIAGGLVILLAIFDLLNIEYMVAATGALRHGALYDLVDRSELSRDIRLATVNRLALNYQVDTLQANRVSHVAQHLFLLLSSYLHQQGIDTTRLSKKLVWAAQLHEIGCLISHDEYHKHGAYILDHADAPGFAIHELHHLSLLVLGHRGKLKKIATDLNCATFSIQLMCLRLAVILCHARTDLLIDILSSIQLSISTQANTETQHTGLNFKLIYPEKWKNTLPQTVFLLEQEHESWKKTIHQLHLEGAV
jgi:exopolyphosphatase / guanosine-5'-triphosphate,3'-diphosphate pyrophosphatase